MILIVAGAAYAASPAIAAWWREAGAHVLRPADLAGPGWRHFIGVPQARGTVPLGRRGVDEAAITGVLTRTPWVTSYELPQIAASDRDYVAAELSALLLSWLASLRCRVVNRPMPGSLAGMPWRQTQWMAAARAAGLRVPAEPGSLTARVLLTVVGTRCFGKASPALHDASIRLAALALSDLLGVAFDGSDADAAFVGATCFPPLDDLEIREALLALLGSWPRPMPGFPDLRPWRRAQPASRAAIASAIG